MFIRLFSILFMLASACAFATNQVVYFQPNQATLSGLVMTLKFPGPPNYESINEGDKEEVGSFLLLDHPINIKRVANSKDNVDEPQINVKLVQLVVLNKEDWKELKEGNHVRVKGTLSSPLTGHHHARALLQVEKISMLKNEKMSPNINDVTDEDKRFLKFQHMQQN